MAEYTYVVDTEKNIYPNLTVCKRLVDGVHNGWRVTANDGYVFYFTNDNNTELVEDEYGNWVEVPVTYYYRITYLPQMYNWANFDLVAKLESEVENPNHIFGGGDNDHEIAAAKEPAENA